MKKIIYFIAALLIVGGCSSDSENLATSDGKGGSLAVFALKGNYLYTVDNTDINVFSLQNSTQPVKVNELFIGFNIETLFSEGDYLYVGSENGMYIYSIQNPEAPQLLSAVQHITSCDPVVANATHAFVTLHSNNRCGSNINRLEVYDTENPTQPQLIHTRNLTQPKGLGLYNNYLFVCDDEIKIFNIQNPAEPVLVESINKVCFDVIIRGNQLFAIGEEAVYRYELNPADINNITFKSSVTF